MSSQRNVLLLNASNISTNLTYPYAFVQVSEIANRFHIRVSRRDMFGIPKDHWIPYLQDELDKTSYDMVLLTLRNTDTLGFGDYHIRAGDKNYHQPPPAAPEQPNYYPIETAQKLIEHIRQITDIPIAAGGYGFSVMPDKIMKYIKPDYGVMGGPDAFFDHFEDIIAHQNLDQVTNLVYRKNEALHKGPLRFFPPSPRREYTDEIMADRQAFYARNYGKEVSKVRSVPIEAVRGCSKSCTFCSEPRVKGPELQYRDIDVIVDEINFLGTHDHNLVFLVSSEINAEGPEFMLKLADRILQINEERSAYAKVYWYTFYLPTLSSEELKHLRSAGFLGGANDIVSLDDKNLAAVKAPYTSSDVIKHLKGAKQVVEEEWQQREEEERPSLEERIYGISPPADVPYTESFMKSWWFFLGNTAATPETIRVTLKAIDEAVGLSQFFDIGAATKATRLFDYIPQDAELLSDTSSFTQNGPTETYNELYPSYAYAPALLRHFGSKKMLENFFDAVGTYLSNAHLFKKDWNWFLAKYVEQTTFLTWWQAAVRSPPELKALSTIPEVQEFLNFLRENPSGENIGLLFNPTPGREKIINLAAHQAIRFVFLSQEEELIPIMSLLGVPPSLEDVLALSPYKVAVKLFEAYADKKKLLDAIKERIINPVAARFFAEYLIYLNGTPLKAENRIFFEQ